MTTKEMIEVMQAYDRGEQIECRARVEGSEWIEQKDSILWNWYTFEYRIKPQHTYRPYNSAAEFLAAQKEHGMYIFSIDYYILPLSVCDNYIRVNDGVLMFCELLNDYTWQDGTPCGVEE